MQYRTSTGEHRTDDRFRSSFPSSSSALIEPRRTFAQWLAEEGLDDSIVAELTVVFSELTSNAAAATPGDDPIEVEAWRDDDDVILSVENPAPDEVVVPQWDLDDALRSGGRGLMIVRAYTDTFEADVPEGGGLRIRCRRRTAS